jgi:hypothetical protein
MNANENPPKISPQMNRIQIVSRAFRAIFFAFFIISIIGIFSLIVSIFVIKSSRFILDYQEVAGVGVEISVGIWAWYCYKLFDLCSRGNLFTSKVVGYIRKVGYSFFLMALVSFISRMVSVHSAASVLQITKINSDWQWMGLLGLLTSLFPGFLILFIAWIMDEGRKIQEEQELTV